MAAEKVISFNRDMFGFQTKFSNVFRIDSSLWYETVYNCQKSNWKEPNLRRFGIFYSDQFKFRLGRYFFIFLFTAKYQYAIANISHFWIEKSYFFSSPCAYILVQPSRIQLIGQANLSILSIIYNLLYYPDHGRILHLTFRSFSKLIIFTSDPTIFELYLSSILSGQ